MQNTISSTHITEMLKLAKAAQNRAYSPYSQFKVGACIRDANNKFYTGCNIENASYSLTFCAEGSAIAHMINDGANKISEIVIVGSSDKPCAPCGACRQLLREFADEHILVHMFDQNGNGYTKPLTELLPDSFGPDFLRK